MQAFQTPLQRQELSENVTLSSMFRRRHQDRAPAAQGSRPLGDVLDILDACANAFTFPMLDNGYVYLAATRLSAFADGIDWALVIEVAGYSPRAGVPDLHVHTYASRLHNRNPESQYVTLDAHRNYLRLNPNNESRFFYPIGDADWTDEEDVATDAADIPLRDSHVLLPSIGDYQAHGIELSDPPRVRVFEVHRLLAAVHRSAVLGTDDERLSSVPPGLPELLVLDDWHHPDLVNGELPSGTATFQQLAQVVLAADASLYSPTEPQNTHWSNWPDGGSL